MNTQKNPQVVRANKDRSAFGVKVEELAGRAVTFNEAFSLTDELQQALQTVAIRPTSLGFSKHDLQHFADKYAVLAAWRAFRWQTINAVYNNTQRPALPEGTDTKKHHKFLGWLRHQPRTALLEERNKAYAHVKRLRLVVSVFEDEIQRRESLALEDERKIAAQQAELKAQEAEQQAVIDSIPAVKLKAPKRKSKSTPKRSEFKKVITSDDGNPFAALKGEVTARQRENWERQPIKKADALKIAGCSAEDFDIARLFALKMGTDEVIDVDNGVIRYRKIGNSVRYEYFGA